MAKGMRSYMNKRTASTFKVQITSMVDMFVIILVFLLKSYSTSPVEITQNEDIRLPASSSYEDPVDVVKMAVTKKGIFVEDQKIVDLENGDVLAEARDPKDPQFIMALFKALDEQAQKTKDIAKQNETVEFDGKILMQADRDLPYSLLQKVMYTSMLAGYADMKLAVASKDF
jgi:biopolymer transport protein ExbD